MITTTFTAEQIATRVAALGADIRRQAGDHEVFLLGVLKGATVFLSDLLRAIDGNVTYGYINAVRDEADTAVAAATEIDFLNWYDIAGKHVYLLKDVVSTGIIENYLLTQLRQKNPASLQLVALLDRPALRSIQLEADFRAFEVADALPFVGYGLEHEGRHGNLPYIGSIE
jgi:hypoxanthine phosphoribosyltransferase